MAPRIVDQLKHAWNAFTNEETKRTDFGSFGGGYGAMSSIRPDRFRPRITNERTIVNAIYNRISVDASDLEFRHVNTDQYGRYKDTRKTGLNNCLSVEANLDQAARAFRIDIFHTLMDKGVIAIVPVDTNLNPEDTSGFDIQSMRVGEILEWYPERVRVRVYNQKSGKKEDITLPKNRTAIVENPFFSVMNEPNSTLQRLVSKLAMLDTIDSQAASGNLDLIIQLPYVIKSDARRAQAEQRRKDIEFQLRGASHGIAYTDGTEKITQLNRPATNQLYQQVESLTTMLYDQLGITPEIMNSSADERVMLNYHQKTIKPMLDAVAEAMRRTFLSTTARTQGQDIMYFRDPFALLTLGDFAEIADKLTRNEVATSNELRGGIGLPPSSEPKADQLRNSNMPNNDQEPPAEQLVPIEAQESEESRKEGELQNDS